MSAAQIYEAVLDMFEAESKAIARDTMFYGRALVCITPNGVSRVPPEDWHTLADSIVVRRRGGE